MTFRTLLVLIGLSVCLAAPSSCGGNKPDPNNPPTPPAYGGEASTGGSAATGGLAPVAGQAGAPQRTKCQQACDNLARLGCPEDQSTCAGQCEILTKDTRFSFDANCRINATTKAQAQACGIASCK
jgi:hypothetical protein